MPRDKEYTVEGVKQIDYKEMVYRSSMFRFSSEKEMSKFFKKNIKTLTKQMFGYEFLSYKPEYYFGGYREFGGNKKRVDYYVTTKCGKHLLIELKCNRAKCENTKAIAQMMEYSILFEAKDGFKPECFIIFSDIDPMIYKIDNKFNLGFEYFVLTKAFNIKLNKNLSN